MFEATLVRVFYGISGACQSSLEFLHSLTS
jgi:hypothetical protein